MNTNVPSEQGPFNRHPSMLPSIDIVCGMGSLNYRQPPRVTAEYLADPIPGFLYTFSDHNSDHSSTAIEPGFYTSVVKPFAMMTVSKCRALRGRVVAKTKALLSRL